MRTPTPETVSKVENMYPNNTGTAFDAFAKDAVFACHSYYTAKAFQSNAYRYLMSIPPAVHGLDQLYYFYINSTYSPGVEQPRIAKQMQTYFRNFILTGEPGGGGCNHKGEIQTPQHWPTYAGMGRWENITADGFELVQGEEMQAKRCELMLELMSDPKNGF